MVFKGSLCKTKLDELLLLHELRVGAVVDDVGAEDGGGQGAVYFFGIEIGVLSIEDEFVTIEAEVDGDVLSEELESEDVAILRSVSRVWGPPASLNSGEQKTYLFPVGDKEVVWLHPVCHRISDERYPVEDGGWFCLASREELADDVAYKEHDEGECHVLAKPRYYLHFLQEFEEVEKLIG